MGESSFVNNTLKDIHLQKNIENCIAKELINYPQVLGCACGEN